MLFGICKQKVIRYGGGKHVSECLKKNLTGRTDVCLLCLSVNLFMFFPLRVHYT